MTDQERADTRAKAQQGAADDLAASMAIMDADLLDSLTNTPVAISDVPMPSFNIRETVTAEAGASISTLVGSSKPKAIEAFMHANEMSGPNSTLYAGRDYALPTAADYAASTGRQGQTVLNTDNARLAQLDQMRMAASEEQAMKGLISNVPSSPAAAPEVVRIPASLNQTFQDLWKQSFPGGVSKENGGTLILDQNGIMGITNLGGLGSTSGTFTPNLSVGLDNTAFGIFHTHPYDASEGGYTGVSFSGGDVASLINSKLTVGIAQSGSDQFLIAKTAKTPTSVDREIVRVDSQARQDEIYNMNGGYVPDATHQVTLENSAKYELVYYRGQNGVFSRVYP